MFLITKKDVVCAAMPIKRAAMPIKRAAMPIKREAMPIRLRSYADKTRSYADGLNDINLACSRRYLPYRSSFLYFFCPMWGDLLSIKRAAMPMSALIARSYNEG